ncbi:hypothetical protein LTR50_002734 [Elasticomyces elasticus]|nr:hypothetical protein LTR50_002734 [Elasticomyces elasticus]
MEICTPPPSRLRSARRRWVNWLMAGRREENEFCDSELERVFQRRGGRTRRPPPVKPIPRRLRDTAISSPPPSSLPPPQSLAESVPTLADIPAQRPDRDLQLGWDGTRTHPYLSRRYHEHLPPSPWRVEPTASEWQPPPAPAKHLLEEVHAKWECERQVKAAFELENPGCSMQAKAPTTPPNIRYPDVMALDTVRFQNFAFGTEAGWSLCLDSFSPMQYWKYRHGYAYSLTRGGFVDGSPYVPLYDRRGECIGSDRLENRARRERGLDPVVG